MEKEEPQKLDKTVSLEKLFFLLLSTKKTHMCVCVCCGGVSIQATDTQASFTYIKIVYITLPKEEP